MCCAAMSGDPGELQGGGGGLVEKKGGHTNAFGTLFDGTRGRQADRSDEKIGQKRVRKVTTGSSMAQDLSTPMNHRAGI